MENRDFALDGLAVGDGAVLLLFAGPRVVGVGRAGGCAALERIGALGQPGCRGVLAGLAVEVEVEDDARFGGNLFALVVDFEGNVAQSDVVVGRAVAARAALIGGVGDGRQREGVTRRGFGAGLALRLAHAAHRTSGRTVRAALRIEVGGQEVEDVGVLLLRGGRGPVGGLSAHEAPGARCGAAVAGGGVVAQQCVAASEGGLVVDEVGLVDPLPAAVARHAPSRRAGVEERLAAVGRRLPQTVVLGRTVGRQPVVVVVADAGAVVEGGGVLDGILQVVRGGHLLVGEEVGGCRSRGVIDRDVVQVVPSGARREGVLASPLVDEALGRARLVVVVAQGAQVARHPAQSVELRSLRRGVVVRHPDVPPPEYPAVGVADGDEGVALPFTGREVDAALLEADVGEQRGASCHSSAADEGESFVAANGSVDTPLPITVASNEYAPAPCTR